MNNSTIKLMNYNVWFNELFIDERLSNLIGLIYYHNCDVLCFQELTPYIFNKLIHKLGLKYPYIVSSPQLEDDLGHGIAIFSKSNIIKYESLKLSNTIADKYLLIAKIKKDNVIYNVATSQLDNINKLKIRQFEQILKYIEKTNNIIFIGDTQIYESEEDQYNLDTKLWNDCWIEDGMNEDKKYTSNFKTNIFVKKNQDRFDRGYYKKKDLEMMSFILVGNEYSPPPSNRFGIVIKLKISDIEKINLELPLVSMTM